MTAARRELLRRLDGSLVDEFEAPVTVELLATGLRAGERFRVVDEATNRRCTYEVLADVVRLRIGEQPDVLSWMLERLRQVGGRRD